VRVISRVRRAGRKVLGLFRQTQGPPQPQTFEEQIYAAVVKDGDTVFDIGANVGTVSTFLARLAGPSGIVMAFEPIWSLYVELCRTIEADRCSRAPIVSLPYGLAETEKRATLQIPNGILEMASLAEPTQWTEAQQGARLIETECRFLSIDAFIAGTRVSAPHFVKLDVEGAELLVLRGASRFFSEGHRPLMLIEIFAPWERAFGYEPWDVLSLLRSLGYQFLFACPEGLIEHEPVQAAPFPREFENGYNVIAFVGDAHRDRVRSLDALRVGGTAIRLPMPPPPQANHVAR